jgi:hypothetical protein
MRGSEIDTPYYNIDFVKAKPILKTISFPQIHLLP